MAQENPDPSSIFLPNACTGRALFMVLLITELVAMALTLAGTIGEQSLLERLIMLSLYLQWIGLCSAAILCQARQWLQGYSGIVVALISYVLLLMVTYVISEAAYLAGQWGPLEPFFADLPRSEFIFRSLGICAIISAVTLRYFWLQHQWRQQVQAEGEARFQALQARIRPHFLFNSLNSIAALINRKPHAAETAVEDLAQLFRVGITNTERRITLEEELGITRAYTRTEYLRLGSRLKVLWDVDTTLFDVVVPPLCIQPLVENAVYHGIEQIPGGGIIRVSAKRHGKQLQIRVENPVPDTVQPSKGSQTAVENIRQRIKIIYGDKAEMHAENHGGKYVTWLDLPIKFTGDAT